MDDAATVAGSTNGRRSLVHLDERRCTEGAQGMMAATTAMARGG
ncbi:hypothetical protein RSPO_m00661 (plasmid) [Ralstonia solanacearum Po82]|uniref:Uncharacterized protein n=1 Tax=Ralstonia solanacearum (strain Po82) TaxID=1031711 RepID=F6G8T0_RALS8|nr:hypothetical protein RSPO_m00661 [Ralstonia solanacearum Po82]